MLFVELRTIMKPIRAFYFQGQLLEPVCRSPNQSNSLALGELHRDSVRVGYRCGVSVQTSHNWELLRSCETSRYCVPRSRKTLRIQLQFQSDHVK